MTTLDTALDAVMELSPDERETLLEIVRRRNIEARREEIAANGREARELFKSGKLKPEPLEDALERLHASLEDE